MTLVKAARMSKDTELLLIKLQGPVSYGRHLTSFIKGKQMRFHDNVTDFVVIYC